MQQKWRKQTSPCFLNLWKFQFNFWMKFHNQADLTFCWDDSLMNWNMAFINNHILKVAKEQGVHVEENQHSHKVVSRIFAKGFCALMAFKAELLLSTAVKYWSVFKLYTSVYNFPPNHFMVLNSNFVQGNNLQKSKPVACVLPLSTSVCFLQTHKKLHTKNKTQQNNQSVNVQTIKLNQVML